MVSMVSLKDEVRLEWKTLEDMLCRLNVALQLSSQEILSSTASGDWNRALMIRYSRKYRESWIQVFSEIHDRGDVAAAVAIVGGTPDGNNGFVVEMPLSHDRQQLP